MRCLVSAVNRRRRAFSGTSMEDRTTSAWVVTRTFVLALYTKFHPSGCLTFVGREGLMLYMIVERFRDENAEPVYRRFRDEGRLAPDVSDTSRAGSPTTLGVAFKPWSAMTQRF